MAETTDGRRPAEGLRWTAPGTPAVGDGPRDPQAGRAPSTDRLAASVRRVHAARATVSAAAERAGARRRLLPPLAVGSAALIGASGVAAWVAAGMHGTAAPSAATATAATDPTMSADTAALTEARQQLSSVEQAIASLRRSEAASAPVVPAPSGAAPSGGAPPAAGAAPGGLPSLPPLPTISVPAPAVHATTGASTVVP